MDYILKKKTNYTPKVEKQGPEPKKVELVKIAIDAHAKSLMSCRQVEGSMAQGPRRLTPEDFLLYAEKETKGASKVVTCYEAGPTGFHLHRSLEALGITNYVVCPTKLDSRHTGVNTDKTDCLELSARLDRYQAGHQKAFTVVSVPTLSQERERRLGRQRDQFTKDRLREATRGRMMLLTEGVSTSNEWWKPAAWKLYQEALEPALVEELERYRRIILALEEEVAALEALMVKKHSSQSRPLGMGAFTEAVLEGEIWDWDRIKSWRSAGAWAGLTGGVSGSGEKSADLSITKTGNGRVRKAVIQMAWRMVRCQPDYWLVKKWNPLLGNKSPNKVHGRRRKKAIVAFARQLFVDLWKWKTGKVTAEKLGWKMVEAQSAS